MIRALAALDFLAQLVGPVLHVEAEGDEARGSGGDDGRELAAIEGVVEGVGVMLRGCLFNPRAF